MRGRTICVILSIESFGWKYMMKRPSMRGRTICVILQNLDEAPVNDSSGQWCVKDSYKMPSRVCKTWIFTFLSNLIFPWETKSWVCITCRKKCLFPDTQNMESKSDAWINFFIKVRFLGLWKMSFFWKFDENIQDLYYWENQHFLFSRKLY